MKNKKKTLLVIGALLSVVVITVGVSFAFFNYAKLGSTENSVTTGTITFLYTEVDKVGAGIKLENAIPITDTAGKMLTGSGNVFNFKVTSTTPTNAAIPYEVTARMKKGSDLDPNVVKVYLTKGETEEEVLLDKYSNLTQTSRVSEDIATEKTIYTGRVPSGSTIYEENFKLRMWVDSETDYSPVTDDEGNTVYPYNNKTFTLTVNVYADAKVLSQEEVDMDNSTKIENVSIGNTELTEVTDKDYQYETRLPEGTTSTTINVQTENPNSTVQIEKVDSIAMKDEKSNIVRLSTAKTVTLVDGINYFKVTITSQNKSVTDKYFIKIKVMTPPAYNIGDAVTAIDGSKWHVLEKTALGEEYVVLLSDYNLNTNGTYNTTCTGYQCSVRAFDPNNTTTYDVNDTNNVGYFMKNTYEPLVKKNLEGTIEVTLPTQAQIEKANGRTTSITNSLGASLTRANSPWLLTTNYWTKTARTSTELGTVVGKDSYFSYTTANNAQLYGVRPVIKTLKENLITD